MISLFIVYLMFWYTSVVQAMTRLQQLSYRKHRYQKDLKKGWWYKPKACIYYLFFSYICLLVSPSKQYSLLLLWMMCLSFILYRVHQFVPHRQAIKYTPRCIRLMLMLYGCLAVMFIILIHLCSFTFFILLTPILYYVPYGMVLIALILMHPIEQIINQYFYEQAKEKLANHSLERIGISGSAGKTSVKNMLGHCLKDEHYVLSTPYSYNTAMGISKTINQQLNHLHEIFICECGIDHPNEMDDIVSLLEPTDVILTPITNQHLATMQTRSQILKEKFKLAQALNENGLLVVYGDDEIMKKACEGLVCQIIYYGSNSDNDYIYHVDKIDENGTSFTLRHLQQDYNFHTRLFGEHAVMNLCAVVAMLHAKGMSFEALQAKINTLPFTPHRLEKKVRKDYILLDDAYNANPQGARFALEVLSKMEGKKIVISSGFVELGSEFISAQAAFGIQACSCCDEIILIGELQCAPIIDAITTTGYDFKHVHLVATMQEALTLVNMLANQKTYVLIENDLPDHYLS